MLAKSDRTNRDGPALSSPFTWAIGLFTATYMIAATVGAFITGNLEFVFYIVVMLLLMAAVGAIHMRFRLSDWLLAALSLWGMAHMAGGLVPVPDSWPIASDTRVLYSWWIIPQRLKYDQIIHAYGFGVTTWACWHVLRKLVARQSGTPATAVTPSAGFLVLCVAAGMGFGALNEVIEFAATLVVPETNVGGYENTGWDLVSNMVGAVISAILIRTTTADQRRP